MSFSMAPSVRVLAAAKWSGANARAWQTCRSGTVSGLGGAGNFLAAKVQAAQFPPAADPAILDKRPRVNSLRKGRRKCTTGLPLRRWPSASQAPIWGRFLPQIRVDAANPGRSPLFGGEFS